MSAFTKLQRVANSALVLPVCRFSTSARLARGEDWTSGGRNQRKPNYKQSNNFRNRDDDYRPRGNYNDHRGGNFNHRNNNRNDGWKSKGFGNSRNNFRRSSSQDADDSKLIERNRRQKQKDDGLMGMPDYDLDKESLATLKYEDLLPEEDLEAKEGLSGVPTEALAEKRLLFRPLVNSLVKNRSYERLTPVQARTLLPILNNQSVVVRAKTGTGKTAAFAIPTIQKVLEAHRQGINQGKVKAVIISPTRELAQQIADEIYKIVNFGGLDDITVQCFVGGLSKQAQLRQANLFEGSRKPPCDIIVATPGRLMDILEEPGVLDKCDQLIFKVFDEADRLLDIGFERILGDIRDKLAQVTPKDHEVPLLLFSATADANVLNFARDEFGSRVKVVDTVPKNEPTANELVDQTAVVCPTWAEVYEATVHRIITDYEAAQANKESLKAIVFMPTVAMVDNFERILKQAVGRTSPLRNLIMAIHGQRSQSSRQVRSDKFRKMHDAVLITTDVVARGMDFPKVSHVIQCGIPPDVASYVHRIGRTARIGNRGKSYMYLTNHVRAYLKSLARENIKPKLETFKQDPEFHEKFVSVVPSSVVDETEANELMNSLMSYMSMLKSRYNVSAGDFVKDMQPFVELYGLESLDLHRANRDVWREKRNTRRPGFGSSRRSRMRW
ncbi:hypothetical protein B9G98_03082 [Wickerhamiella sorbophila]|uniref:ATP-dependent RNA helicase n=1 Tax=Wickerhamiella sorbophila TaxID=45607 RepID=A0A2T0FKF4_9ASCO|nr:hypothetical protein B9G98_03082 [Wickerhamiella sorbophila]PRT55462.1 hypothetical protein B9G98_03082 [Wickerhamiella sorbophila]